MGPSNIRFLSFGVIFHFHDYGRKGRPLGKAMSTGLREATFWLYISTSDAPKWWTFEDLDHSFIEKHVESPRFSKLHWLKTSQGYWKHKNFHFILNIESHIPPKELVTPQVPTKQKYYILILLTSLDFDAYATTMVNL